MGCQLQGVVPLTVPLPEHAIGVALNFGVFIGHFEAFGRPQAVLLVNLYAKVAATELLTLCKLIVRRWM